MLIDCDSLFGGLKVVSCNVFEMHVRHQRQEVEYLVKTLLLDFACESVAHTLIVVDDKLYIVTFGNAVKHIACQSVAEYELTVFP